jgi:hypothetical protein
MPVTGPMLLNWTVAEKAPSASVSVVLSETLVLAPVVDA